jgi:AcrR family transcriptional regulator
MSSRKQQLLDSLIAYLIRHGPTDLSLRPMAAEMGTSARLLIFHFGSKERLLTEALDEIQARLKRSFLRLQAGSSGSRSKALLRIFWDWAVAEEQFHQLRLLYQLQVLAAQDSPGRAGHLARSSSEWLGLIKSALPEPERTASQATLLGAVFDGLFLELMCTGDRKRTTRALDAFVAMVWEQREKDSPSTNRRSK